MALTKKLKTTIAFIDLFISLGYGLKKEIFSEFLHVIQCKTLSKLFNNTFDIGHLTVYN